MVSTRKMTALLILVLAGWFVIYYKKAGPVSADIREWDGLRYIEGDTIAHQPEEQAPVIEPEPEPQPVEPEPEPEPEPVILPRTTEYVVKEGDTMRSIAREWFGDANKWVLIAYENPLVDPQGRRYRMKAGMTLRLPPRDARLTEIPEDFLHTLEGIRYIVSRGDTLSGIAKAYYGDPNRFRLIHDANRAALGNDPNAIREGMELLLPPLDEPAEP